MSGSHRERRGLDRFLIFGLAAVLLAVTCEAQAPSGEELEDLAIEDLMQINVKVASMSPDTLLDVPSTVTVIDHEMIRDFNIRTVAEALDLVAGMSVLRTYLKRDLPTARGLLQDHYANKVLVMINNVPTWMAVTGEGCLDRIDINDVARIEVLKGPASVLYGTNAYAAAINIVLKDAVEYRSGVQLGIADRYGYRAGGRVLHREGELELFASANAFDDPSGSLTFTDESGASAKVEEFMRSNNVTLTAKTPAHSALANVYEVEESFLGTTPTFALGAGHPHRLRGYLANYTYSADLGQKIDLNLGATLDWNERDFARSDNGKTRASVKGQRLNGFANALFAITSSLKLEAGLEWEERTSKEYRNYDARTDATLADNNMRDRSVTESSVFAQADYRRSRFRLLVGTRYTDNELFGSNVSSRASVVYRVGERSSIKAMLGQSYRVPSLFELYFQTPTNTVYGNTELKPEKNDTIELAFLTHAGSFFLEGLLYHAQYDDKIFRTRRYPIYVPDPADTSTIYVNGGTFSADGVELGVSYRRPRSLNAFLTYGYVDGDRGDVIPGTDHYNFKYVPSHTVALGLAKHINHVSLSAVARYQSERGAPVATIDASTTFDLNFTIRQRLGSISLRHVVSAKNLTDEEVEIPEYVRLILNSVPAGYGSRISYTLHATF